MCAECAFDNCKIMVFPHCQIRDLVTWKVTSRNDQRHDLRRLCRGQGSQPMSKAGKMRKHLHSYADREYICTHVVQNVLCITG